METMHRRRILTASAAFLFAAALAVPPAAAQTLDSLRKSGVIGERYDGLLELRDSSASSEARRMVKDVNAKRSKIYEKRAKEQGVPVGQVGRVFAQEIFQKAPKGTWFLGEDGRWTRK
jgi:uncharacterized protein YdbL (DUF1318 family)